MWVLNTERNTLINLDTGRRVVTLPAKAEDQTFAIVAQSPIEIAQPLTRVLPTGYNNTVLFGPASLDDCQSILDRLHSMLNAWAIPHAPVEIDMPETVILRYTDHHKTTSEFICEDELTARRWLYKLHVVPYWPGHLGEVPADVDEALERFYANAGTTESYRIIPSPYIKWVDTKGG